MHIKSFSEDIFVSKTTIKTLIKINQRKNKTECKDKRKMYAKIILTFVESLVTARTGKRKLKLLQAKYCIM